MSMFHRRRHEVPGLNTASLPDLIFTVLFFFMIVTHMRKVTLRVKYTLPQGTELTRLVKRSTVSYICIGAPLDGSGETRIQLNDKFVDTKDIEYYLRQERRRLSDEDLPNFMVSLKADKNTKMGVINDVKQALRRADALKISYAATEEK